MAQINPLLDNFYLGLTIDEAVYLRGSLRRDVKGLKNGDERDFLMRILDRLQRLMFDESKYSKGVPF